MKRSTIISAAMLFVMSGFIGCNKSQKSELLTASVQEALNSPTTLSIADEIESAEYIPLEVTNNDASLIDGVVDFAITSKYIYVPRYGRRIWSIAASPTGIPCPRFRCNHRCSTRSCSN